MAAWEKRTRAPVDIKRRENIVSPGSKVPSKSKANPKIRGQRVWCAVRFVLSAHVRTTLPVLPSVLGLHNPVVTVVASSLLAEARNLLLLGERRLEEMRMQIAFCLQMLFNLSLFKCAAKK